MRILYLTHNVTEGAGTYRRVHALAKNLVPLGHELTLLAGARAAHLSARIFNAEGVQVFEVPDVFPYRLRQGGLSPLDVLGRLRHVRHHFYDLIYAVDHRPAVAIPALQAKRRYRVPLVVDWADLWGRDGIARERNPLLRETLGRADEFYERRFRLRAEGLTVITRDMQRRAEQDYGIPRQRILYLPAGANVDTIQPLPKDDMRRKHLVPMEAHVAMYSGLAPWDAATLAKTFVVMARRDPLARFMLVGGQFAAFDRIVEAAGVSDRVIRIGFVPFENLAEILACADVMMLPFANRGVNKARYPNKLGDYMAAGRPTITNPTGDVGAMVQSEGIGLVVGESPEDMAEATLHLFENPERAHQFGMRARQAAESTYSWQSLARQVDAFFQRIVADFRH